MVVWEKEQRGKGSERVSQRDFDAAEVFWWPVQRWA